MTGLIFGGLTLQGKDFIVIGTPVALNTILLIHYIGHELGHILLNHQPRPLDIELSAQEMRQIFKALKSDVDVSALSILHGQCRSMSPDDPEEVEAEYVARHLNLKIRQAELKTSSIEGFQGSLKKFHHIPIYMGFTK